MKGERDGTGLEFLCGGENEKITFIEEKSPFLPLFFLKKIDKIIGYCVKG